MGGQRTFEVKWVPTDREKRAARALGIDIDELPEWLARTYRRFTLREIAEQITRAGVPVTHEWVRMRLRQFGIPTKQGEVA